MSNRQRALLALATSAAILAPSPTFARQTSDIVIMRKVMPDRLTPGSATTPMPSSGAKGEWRTGDWTWSSREFCTSAAPQVRAVDCVSGGNVVADQRCAPTPRPETTRTAPRTGGCYYVWKAGEWSDPVPACGETTQTRTMTCSRSDGTPAPESMCTTRKGSTVQPSVDFSECGYSWTAGAWDDWDSTCSPRATRSRKVQCTRSDDSPVQDGQCLGSGAKPSSYEMANMTEGCDFRWETTYWMDAGEHNACGPNPQSRIVRCVNVDGGGAEDEKCSLPRPEDTRIETDRSGCSFDWQYGQWDEITPSCGPTTQTRSASCRRSDGKIVESSNCTETANLTRQVADYRACSYDWEVEPWSDWSSSCSPSSMRQRKRTCLRSDGTQEDVLSHCPSPAPSIEERSAVYSGCRYNWTTTQWIRESGCGEVPQTREVQCTRQDGTKATSDLCDPATRPSDSGVGTSYDSCSYAYRAGEWTAWNSTCSAKARRTRRIDCMREDGQDSDTALCTDTKPVDTEVADIYSGCGYAWKSEGYPEAQPSCGPVTTTERFSCLRSDGTKVEDALCTSPKPNNVNEGTDYRTCTFAWQKGTWSPWSSTCSATAQRVRDVTCHRSDGSIVNSGCSTADMPVRSETAAIYTGCGYEWSPDAWASPSYCGNVVQYRNVPCRRSDGTTVNDSFCTGAKPATEQNGTDYSACTYAWTTGSWTAYDSSCSTSAKRTRNVQCQRSDLAIVENSLCTGTMPAREETTGIFTGCSYKWMTYPWESTYACSESDVQRRRVECTRIDDISSVVADSYCSSQGAKPTTTQTVSNVSGCSAATVNSNFENDLYGWNFTQPVSVSTTISHDGSKSIKMDPHGQLRQYVSTVQGKTYTLSYWAYTKNGLYMNSYGPQGRVIENKSLSNVSYQWVYFSGTFQGTGGVVQIGFYHYAPSGGSSWLDEVKVN